MLDSIHATPTLNTSAAERSLLNGIDVMSMVQILLIKDYDEQLRHTGSNIKGIVNAKKKYREQVGWVRSLLNNPSKNFDSDHLEKVVKITRSDLKRLKGLQEFLPLPDGTSKGRAKHYGDVNESKRGKTKTHVYVQAQDLEKIIEGMKEGLDTLNEQSEMTSLSLQSLTSQRKIAFESLSQLIHNQSGALQSIVRNIG